MVWKRWHAKANKAESDTSAHVNHELWVWIRVPLSALERAISALQERVPFLHRLNKRDEANSDSRAVEDIKKSLREDHDDKSQF